MNAASEPGIRVGDAPFLLDLSAIAAVSAAICLRSQTLLFMTIFVPTVLIVRLLVFAALPRRSRGHSLGVEILFFGICTVLGAFNDWNSVVNKGVYQYHVPAEFPEWSSIPLWMLLYWGMILRFLASIAYWKRLGDSGSANNAFLFRAKAQPWIRIASLLAIVFITRQCIYRFYLDPVLSWLPFAVGLGIYAAAFRPQSSDRRLIFVFALGGVAIEILYIQVGHLHSYALGWIGGVPLWIALWWLLAVVIWKDLAGRILRGLCGNRSHARPAAEKGTA